MMVKVRSPIVLTALVVIALLVGVGVADRLRSDTGPVVADDGEQRTALEALARIEDLQQEVARLSRAVGRLEAASRRTAANSAPGGRVPSTMSTAERAVGSTIERGRVDDADANWSDAVEEAAVAHELDERFLEEEARHLREARDHIWASQQEDVVHELVNADERYAGIQIDGMECRSHTCRLDLFIETDLEPHVEPMLIGELGRSLPNATWMRDGRQLTLVLTRTDFDPVQ